MTHAERLSYSANIWHSERMKNGPDRKTRFVNLEFGALALLLCGTFIAGFVGLVKAIW
ncbi:hypothetical protein [Sphingomonas japonica]|nr:hypothetical protein [Sphingomonas japonica]